jgi:hypothetical protein
MSELTCKQFAGYDKDDECHHDVARGLLHR